MDADVEPPTQFAPCILQHMGPLAWSASLHARSLFRQCTIALDEPITPKPDAELIASVLYMTFVLSGEYAISMELACCLLRSTVRSRRRKGFDLVRRTLTGSAYIPVMCRCTSRPPTFDKFLMEHGPHLMSGLPVALDWCTILRTMYHVSEHTHCPPTQQMVIESIGRALSPSALVDYRPSTRRLVVAGAEPIYFNTVCPACTEDIVEGQSLYPLTCRHVMHGECALEWRMHHTASGCPTCPLCRHPDQDQDEVLEIASFPASH